MARPGPWTSGEGEEALPAWAPAPGPLPEGFEASGPRASSPSRLRARRPPPYSPARWGSALPAALRSSAGWKPTSASKSSGLVRPWPRLSSVGPWRQSPGVAPPSLQAALPVGPQRPSFLGSAPPLALCPFRWAPPLLRLALPPNPCLLTLRRPPRPEAAEDGRAHRRSPRP